ncbi:MAG: radical SAM/SPASM domain-containing protein [Candidatus Coprovivens sp.]
MFKKVYVEITNNCNLNCSFCNGNKRRKKFIDIDEFKIILDKLDGFTKYLYFHVMGEPLLHPKINELIDLASQKYYVNITSNGYLINRIKDNKNIRQLNISLHSFNVKNNKSLDDYMNDIFDIVDCLVKNNTYIKYRLWVNCVDKDKIINKLVEKYDVLIKNEKQYKLSDNVYFEVEEEFIWPNLDNDYYSKVGSCMGCRTHIGILVDGTVIPCCLDSNGIINLGNIYKDNLSDIINGDLFQTIKNGFLNNKKCHELCRKCNFYDLRR